jgi:hypothetical protein
MNQNVKPLTAFLIILTGICLISLIFWARGESLDVGGPDQMQLDPDGNVVIHISDKLYRLTPSLELQASYDLAEMGVDDLVGDFAFFSNGDMLIRKGKYNPGLLESISRYLRMTETKAPVATYDNEGLYRCSQGLKTCSPFGRNQLDFDSAFHLSIDIKTNTVYVSDTSRHKLRKFDAQGNELSVSEKRFKFPNQNSLQNDKLLVADTNHHAIQIVETDTENFGEILRSHSILNPILKENIWPYSFAKIGVHWWVNNLSTSMSNGTIAIYDKNWQFVETIKLPTDADPFDFAVLDEQVLITDLNNNRIYQLDYQGQLISNSLPQEITKKLAQLQKSRLFYIYLSYIAVGLFAVFLIAGFIVAFIQKLKESEEPVLTAPIIIDINDPEIKWVAVNKQKVQLLKLIMLTPLFVILIAWMEQYESVFKMSLLLAMLVIIIALSLAYQLFSKKVGTLGDTLIIKKYNGEYAAGRKESIFFSDAQLLIGSIPMSFNWQRQFFNTEQVIKEVMPLLSNATYVQPRQMMSMILKRQHPLFILVAFLFIMLGTVTLMFNGIQQ